VKYTQRYKRLKLLFFRVVFFEVSILSIFSSKGSFQPMFDWPNTPANDWAHCLCGSVVRNWERTVWKEVTFFTHFCEFSPQNDCVYLDKKNTRGLNLPSLPYTSEAELKQVVALSMHKDIMEWRPKKSFTLYYFVWGVSEKILKQEATEKCFIKTYIWKPWKLTPEIDNQIIELRGNL
jgi:hypothetical protein